MSFYPSPFPSIHSPSMSSEPLTVAQGREGAAQQAAAHRAAAEQRALGPAAGAGGEAAAGA